MQRNITILTLTIRFRSNSSTCHTWDVSCTFVPVIYVSRGLGFWVWFQQVFAGVSDDFAIVFFQLTILVILNWLFDHFNLEVLFLRVFWATFKGSRFRKRFYEALQHPRNETLLYTWSYISRRFLNRVPCCCFTWQKSKWPAKSHVCHNFFVGDCLVSCFHLTTKYSTREEEKNAEASHIKRWAWVSATSHEPWYVQNKPWPQNFDHCAHVSRGGCKTLSWLPLASWIWPMLLMYPFEVLGLQKKRSSEQVNCQITWTLWVGRWWLGGWRSMLKILCGVNR